MDGFGPDESSSEESEESGEEEEEEDTRSFIDVSAALAKSPLFEKCNEYLLEAIEEKAPRYQVEPGESLELQDGGPMLVVESGALEVSVGRGPAVTLGPGTILNQVGMLGLIRESEPFVPKGSSRSGGEKVVSASKSYECFAGAAPPAKYLEAKRAGHISSQGPLGEDGLCIYNLCPDAVFRADQVGSLRKIPAGWLPMSIKGANPFAVPLTGGTPDGFKHGGAVLASASLSLINQLGRPLGGETGADKAMAIRNALVDFQASKKQISDIWRIILVRCSTMLRAVPPEILWAIASTAKRRVVEAGQVIVREGDFSQDGGEIILVDDGRCMVEKEVTEGKEVKTIRRAAVGHIGPGAVIGDLTLISAGVPTPATVRADTLVELVTIPVRGLLTAMASFPGLVSGVEHRLREVASLLQMRIPLRLDSLSTVRMFSASDMGFLTEFATSGERHAFYCGQPIIEEGKEDHMFCLLEFGACAKEVRASGQVGDVFPGSCFGERLLQGRPGKAEFTVRVRTPLAMITSFTQKAVNAVLGRHPQDRRRFAKAEELQAGFGFTKLLSHIQVFSGCTPRFLEQVCELLENKGYLPGQPIVIEGAQDAAASMYIVRGGIINVEKDRKRVGELSIGSCFGEFIMLGAAKRRQSTCRAMTIAFAMEITRDKFLGVLNQFPEERQSFERVAINHMDEVGTTISLLKAAPTRLLYRLNLYAERRICAAGRVALEAYDAENIAVLVVLGEAAVQDYEGNELDVVTGGGSFNEQVLVGAPSAEAQRLVTLTACEIQLISTELWDKVMEEFDAERAVIRQSVMRVIGEKAEFRKGYPIHGSPELFRNTSTLFSTASDEFLGALGAKFEGRLHLAGETIIASQNPGDEMVILIEGDAYIQAAGKKGLQSKLEEGSAFGEAVMLGVTEWYGSMLMAKSVCIVQCLRRADFLEVLGRHPGDSKHFELFLQEADAFRHLPLQERLASLPLLDKAPEDFIEAICQNAEDLFVRPGHTIVEIDEPCMFGHAPLFVLLAGRASVEGQLGVHLGRLEPGDIFGESGALGLSEARVATIRATKEGHVHCVRFRGKGLEAGLRLWPDAHELLEELCTKRQEGNREIMARQRAWLEATVVPALAQTPLLAGCPEALLTAVGAPLSEAMYMAGEDITIVGEEANSMIVILEGAAEIITKSGAKVGTLEEGSVFGEVAALGLFFTRTATIRALCKCRVLGVTADALGAALALPEAAAVKSAFEDLVTGRRKQVASGLPLSALPIGVEVDDVCVRGIALHAECVDVAAGDIWDIYPDTDPCGSHFSIFVQGQALIETDPGGHLISSVSQGSLLLEALAANYGARVRAVADCRGYRIRRTDFQLLVSSLPSSHKWLHRFRMLEKETERHLMVRLSTVRGITEGLERQRNDDAIHEWKARREKAMDRACKIRIRKADEPGRLPPVGLPPTGRYSGGIPYPAQGMRREASAPELRCNSSRASSRRSRASSRSSCRTPTLPVL